MADEKQFKVEWKPTVGGWVFFNDHKLESQAKDEAERISKVYFKTVRVTDKNGNVVFEREGEIL